MGSSATSFYSEKPMNKQQQESLKKATAKPFDMRKSSSNFKRHVEDMGSSKENLKNEDDLISEISTPDIDWSERKKIMEALAQREKDREELELDKTFKQLIDKAQGVNNDSIEESASQAANEYRKTGQMNIYKPSLRTTPRLEQDKGVVKASHNLPKPTSQP